MEHSNSSLDGAFVFFYLIVLACSYYTSGAFVTDIFSYGYLVVLATGIIFAAAGAWITYLMSKFFHRYHSLSLGKTIILCAFAGLVGLYPAIKVVATQSYIAENKRQTAKDIQAYLLNHFDILDNNNDGTISLAELQISLSKSEWTTAERKLIERAQNEIDELGHTVSIENSVTFFWVSDGRGGGFLSPITIQTPVFGISKNDLATYPTRLAEKYRKW